MLSTDKYKLLNQQVIEKLALGTTGGFVDEIKRQNNLLYIRGVINYREGQYSEEYVVILADERLEPTSYKDGQVSFFPSCIRIRKPAYTFTLFSEETSEAGESIPPSKLGDRIKELEIIENQFKRKVKYFKLKRQFRSKLNRLFSETAHVYNNQLIEVLEGYAPKVSVLVEARTVNLGEAIREFLANEGKKHQYRHKKSVLMDNTALLFVVPSTIDSLNFTCYLAPVDAPLDTGVYYRYFDTETLKLADKNKELLDKYASKTVRKWEEATIIAAFKKDMEEFFIHLIKSASFPNIVMSIRKRVEKQELKFVAAIAARKKEEKHLIALQAANKLIDDLF